MTRNKEKGVSLAKGPVGIIGIALLAYGISALIFGGHQTRLDIPSGTVNGDTWLGLEINLWSSLLFTGAGALLLFGAPTHWGAKSLSLIVGLVLGAASVIALVDGDDVLGIFAANGWTKLAWGAAGTALIVLSLLPRIGGKKKHDDDGAEQTRPDRRVQREPQPVKREQASAEEDVDDRRGGGSVVAPASGTTPESRDTTRRQRNREV